MAGVVAQQAKPKQGKTKRGAASPEEDRVYLNVDFEEHFEIAERRGARFDANRKLRITLRRGRLRRTCRTTRTTMQSGSGIFINGTFWADGIYLSLDVTGP